MTAHTVSCALKKLVTMNIDEIYYSTLDLDVVSIREIVAHLKLKYYRISSQTLAKNDTILCQNWNPDTPIEHYYKKVKLYCELATDAKEEYTDTQIMQIMHVQMLRVEAFKPATREWRQKQDGEKTLNNFKTHFIDAYDDLLDDEAAEEEEEAQPGEAHNAIPIDLLQAIYAQAAAQEPEEAPPSTTLTPNIVAMMQNNTQTTNDMLKKILEQLVVAQQPA